MSSDNSSPTETLQLTTVRNREETLFQVNTYYDEPTIPAVVTKADGSELFTRSDIMEGQQIFLSNGLMEYGSIFGHGAYLRPDFATEYLHRAALSSIDLYGGPDSDRARSRTIEELRSNRYNPATDVLLGHRLKFRTPERRGTTV